MNDSRGPISVIYEEQEKGSYDNSIESNKDLDVPRHPVFLGKDEEEDVEVNHDSVTSQKPACKSGPTAEDLSKLNMTNSKSEDHQLASRSPSKNKKISNLGVQMEGMTPDTSLDNPF